MIGIYVYVGVLNVYVCGGVVWMCVDPLDGQLLRG